MTRNVAYLLKTATALIAGLMLLLAAHSAAFADEDGSDEADLDTLNMTAYELQTEIEDRQAAYAAAREEADAAAAKIDETLQRIGELEQQIPQQQQRSAQAAREQYKLQQQSAGIVDLLLSADNFFDFLSYVEYMDRVSDANSAEMARLSQLKAEIVAEQASIRDAQREAEAKAEDARTAMEAAQEAQAEVQRRIEEEVRQQAEIAAMAEALAAEERNNDVGTVASSTGSGNSAAGDGEGDSGKSGKSGKSEKSGDSGDSDSSDDSEATDEPEEEPEEEAVTPAGDDTTDGWAARIDAYLAGSPLAGQGATFANAAATYGVDPRLSPAISFTESSKGLYCFKPYNAWGWGSSSWSSWEEAIDAHVAGLARGYGGQLTVDGAKKYCPPNWETWYNRTLAQMNLI